jgi:glycosidase
LHYLGVNIVYILPICSVGRARIKGNAGSPYSVRDPFEIDDRLSEPALGFGSETEFAAFSECAKALSMKVVKYILNHFLI